MGFIEGSSNTLDFAFEKCFTKTSKQYIIILWLEMLNVDEKLQYKQALEHSWVAFMSPWQEVSGHPQPCPLLASFSLCPGTESCCLEGQTEELRALKESSFDLHSTDWWPQPFGSCPMQDPQSKRASRQRRNAGLCTSNQGMQVLFH